MSDVREEIEADRVEKVVSWHGRLDHTEDGSEKLMLYKMSVVIFVIEIYTGAKPLQSSCDSLGKASDYKVTAYSVSGVSVAPRAAAPHGSVSPRIM